MAIRIKSRWHRSERNAPAARTMEDHAGALAFIAWRLAVEHAKTLHREGFVYESDRERIAVITEYCGFAIQVVDRLVHERVGDEERDVLVNTLGHRLADQMQDNLDDIAGPGAYRAPFIASLNERLDAYATLGFSGREPAFDNLRYFARRVLDEMGESQTNRWVMDQVMEISGPEFAERLARSVDDLLGDAA